MGVQFGHALRLGLGLWLWLGSGSASGLQYFLGNSLLSTPLHRSSLLIERQVTLRFRRDMDMILWHDVAAGNT